MPERESEKAHSEHARRAPVPAAGGAGCFAAAGAGAATCAGAAGRAGHWAGC